METTQITLKNGFFVDSNQTYIIRETEYGGGECHSKLLTDGITECEGVTYGRTAFFLLSCKH